MEIQSEAWQHADLAWKVSRVNHWLPTAHAPPSTVQPDAALLRAKVNRVSLVEPQLLCWQRDLLFTI